MLNSSGACGPLTVMTGSGSENWCTLYIQTRPTLTAMTATSGIQIRARTVRAFGRGLTQSPLRNAFPRISSFDPTSSSGHISTSLIYGRYDVTSTERRRLQLAERYHHPAHSAAPATEPQPTTWAVRSRPLR